MNTFSNEELNTYANEGCHIVGMVHDKKETTAKNFPKGIYDYWNVYEAHKSRKTIMTKHLVEYFRRGIDEFQTNGEKIHQILIHQLVKRNGKKSYLT